MRFRTALTIGALALAPAMALAAQPLMVHVDGQTIPMQESTHVIQTAAGPARVSTWHWRSPNGHDSIEIQTSTGGAPPAWALHQMQAMQTQFRVMQAQMQQLEQATLSQPFMLPAPLAVMFVPPAWMMNGMSGPITVVAPSPHTAPAQSPHTAGLRI